MRGFMIAGIILILLGAFVLIQGGTFTSERSVLEVGELEITADEKQTIPTWVGALSLVAGIGLVGAGAMNKKG